MSTTNLEAFDIGQYADRIIHSIRDDKQDIGMKIAALRSAAETLSQAMIMEVVRLQLLRNLK